MSMLASVCILASSSHSPDFFSLFTFVRVSHAWDMFDCTYVLCLCQELLRLCCLLCPCLFYLTRITGILEMAWEVFILYASLDCTRCPCFIPYYVTRKRLGILDEKPGVIRHLEIRPWRLGLVILSGNN